MPAIGVNDVVVAGHRRGRPAQGPRPLPGHAAAGRARHGGDRRPPHDLRRAVPPHRPAQSRRPDRAVDAVRALHLPRRADAGSCRRPTVWVTHRVGYDRLVLSACHPLYSAAKRIVVFAAAGGHAASGCRARELGCTTPSIRSPTRRRCVHMTVTSDSDTRPSTELDEPARDGSRTLRTEVRHRRPIRTDASRTSKVESSESSCRARLRRGPRRSSPRRSSSVSRRGGVAPSDATAQCSQPRQRSAPGAADLHATSAGPSRTSPIQREPGRRAVGAPPGGRRAELVVLAAGRGELGRIAPQRLRDLRRRRERAGAPRRRARAARRSPRRAAAASEARPSERSSIARAPARASARPSASRGRGRR